MLTDDIAILGLVGDNDQKQKEKESVKRELGSSSSSVTVGDFTCTFT